MIDPRPPTVAPHALGLFGNNRYEFFVGEYACGPAYTDMPTSSLPVHHRGVKFGPTVLMMGAMIGRDTPVCRSTAAMKPCGPHMYSFVRSGFSPCDASAFSKWVRPRGGSDPSLSDRHTPSLSSAA